MSTDFRLNSIFLPLSEVSISPQTGRALMSFRSDRISQIPFQMPFHTCRSLSPSVLPLLPLALSCGTCILSPPKNYAMHGSVLFLLFFIGSSVAFPDRDWFMRTSTWAYISRGRLYCTLYLTSVSIRPWNIAAPTRSRSLSPVLSWSICLSSSFDGSPTWHDKFHARYYRRGHTMAKADTKFIAHPGP